MCSQAVCHQAIVILKDFPNKLQSDVPFLIGPCTMALYVSHWFAARLLFFAYISALYWNSLGVVSILKEYYFAHNSISLIL